MIHLINNENLADAVEIVRAALVRSFSDSMVNVTHFDTLLKSRLSESVNIKPILVCISPLDSWCDALIAMYEAGAIKLVLLGDIPLALASYLNVNIKPFPNSAENPLCEPAVSFHDAESSLKVIYEQAIGSYESPIQNRPFVRYDFTDEWNNLGFGAIQTDGSIWSVGACVTVPSSNEIARIYHQEAHLGAYAAIWTNHHASLLWFNRPVGPVDSQEWSLIEHYLSNFESETLPCLPYLSEIPHGYDAAVTMRLDCDEDIESARALFDAYQQMDVPFSLAIHTKVLDDAKHYILPKEVLAAGGALLSHTATHAPDWGGSYEAALNEGMTSRALIKSHIGYEVDFAVSPFHQTPVYAREALSKAGYLGCIGGIIRNDPDFLMARSGVPPFCEDGFVGHSQQCMLHGDCMLENGDPLRIFKQAFDYAYQSNTFFGFLDHPFSPRYQYGWVDESQRIAAHQTLISYIRTYDHVLFANAMDAMQFLTARSSVCIVSQQDGFAIEGVAAAWPMRVYYKGQQYALTEQGLKL